MSFARAALPWLIAAVLVAAAMVFLARRVLPKPQQPNARTARVASLGADPGVGPSGGFDRPAHPGRAPSSSPGVRPPASSAPTEPASAGGTSAEARRRAFEAEAMARAWQKVDALRERLAALEADAGPVQQTAAAAVRMLDVPHILDEAGMSEEPFASRLRTYRDACGDGGRTEALRASIFLPEDAERLRLLDAVEALGRPPAARRGDAGSPP